MTAKLERVWEPKPWRAVDYKESSIQKAITKKGWVHVEAKVDGIRCILWRNPEGDILPYTREGIVIAALAPLIQELDKTPTFSSIFINQAIDCEVLLQGISFEESSGILRRKTALPAKQVPNLKFYAFNRLAVVEGSLTDCGEGSDHLALANVYYNCPLFEGVPRRLVRSLDGIQEAYEQYRAEGFEGAIVKDCTLPYQNGKKSGWWKVKPSITVGGVVTGVRYGDADKANAGKVVGVKVLLEDGAECTATGLTQAQIAEFTENQAKIVGRAVEVEAMERTAEGNLRHPRFRRFRDFEGAEGVEQ